jgi:hypothetical protein
MGKFIPRTACHARAGGAQHQARRVAAPDLCATSHPMQIVYQLTLSTPVVESRRLKNPIIVRST